MLVFHREKNKDQKDTFSYKFYMRDTTPSEEVQETSVAFQISVNSFTVEIDGKLTFHNQEELELFAKALGSAWQDFENFKVKEEYYKKVMAGSASNEIN